jgi:hypothetical protein
VAAPKRMSSIAVAINASISEKPACERSDIRCEGCMLWLRLEGEGLHRDERSGRALRVANAPRHCGRHSDFLQGAEMLTTSQTRW